MTPITTQELVEALGINRHDAEYEFTDRFGVRYTGASSHLVLAALAREDVTEVPCTVREVVQLLTEWFTCQYVDPVHAATFAGMHPAAACELIAHVTNHGDPEALSRVGPQSLAVYTAYLLEPHEAGVSFPTIVDSPCYSLVDFDTNPASLLQITPVVPEGVDEVEVPVAIEATEAYSWDFCTRLSIPVSQLNALLMGRASELAGFVEDNRDQIEDDISDRGSEGLNVASVALIGPRKGRKA